MRKNQFGLFFDNQISSTDYDKQLYVKKNGKSQILTDFYLLGDDTFTDEIVQLDKDLMLIDETINYVYEIDIDNINFLSLLRHKDILKNDTNTGYRFVNLDTKFSVITSQDLQDYLITNGFLSNLKLNVIINNRLQTIDIDMIEENITFTLDSVTFVYPLEMLTSLELEEKLKDEFIVSGDGITTTTFTSIKDLVQEIFDRQVDNSFNYTDKINIIENTQIEYSKLKFNFDNINDYDTSNIKFEQSI